MSPGLRGLAGAAGAEGSRGRDGRDGRDGASRPSQRLLPIAVVVLALLMGGNYVYLLSGVRQRAECEGNERARIGALSDDNQNRLILGVAEMMTKTKPDAQQSKAERRAEDARFRVLFTDFTTQAQEISSQREALAQGKVCK